MAAPYTMRRLQSDMFIGIDGCSPGWIAVAITDRGFREARLLSRFTEVMANYATAGVLGADIPIGLVDAVFREADRAARAFLVGQSSSVFNAPPRAALTAQDYDEAKRD
jgi:predicted RNase H-like nuclease